MLWARCLRGGEPLASDGGVGEMLDGGVGGCIPPNWSAGGECAPPTFGDIGGASMGLASGTPESLGEVCSCAPYTPIDFSFTITAAS